MNPRVKDFLGVIAGLGVVAFGILSWMYVDAFSRSIEPSSFRSFAVSGQGEVTAIPDVAQFTFSVITQGGTNIAGLQKQNVEKTNQAIAFVKQQGVEEKDIKTQIFSLEPRYQYFNCGSRPLGREAEVCPPPEIVGYTVQQSVQVKARDFAKVGDIISGVVDNGANSVSQLFFTIDDRVAVENEAREQAMQKAKEKAQAVAEAAGVRLGRLLSIQEGTDPVFLPLALDRAAAESGMGGAAPAPRIEPGSQEVVVQVTLRYEIQ